MLQKLSITNYALISKKIIDFNKEFTVITGETGAGKSIIFGAIELLIGTRSSNKVLKNPKSKCVVEGVFSMNENVVKQLLKMDLDIEDDLIIRREIKQNGNSRSFINDSPVKLEQLKLISQYILEINGQHLVSKMGSLNFKYGFIDSFINDKKIFLDYSDAFLNYVESIENQERIIKKVNNLNEKKDYLQFQLDELSNYNIDQWDEESIQNEHQIAANQEEINTLLYKIKNIYNSNGGFSDLFSDLETFSTELDTILNGFSSVSKRLKSVNNDKSTIELKNIIINRMEYKVVKDGVDIVLPRKEFELFYLLASKPGNVFTRFDIMNKVWGSNVIVGDRTIDVHIRKLREKVGNSYFKTIKGVGYKFAQ